MNAPLKIGDVVGYVERPERADAGAALRWYVVRSNVNCEQRAAKGLRAAGFQVFLPMRKVVIRHARKTQEVERPLFVRYLFVGLDLARHRWYPVRSTHGVESILGDGGVPHPVPDAEVRKIMRAQDAGLFDSTRAPSNLQPGEPVMVDGGPLGQFVGEVVACDDDRQRVEILHNFLGSLRRMHVDLARVRRDDTNGA
jgi:transcriptional antiterminator RfaH